MVLLVLFAALAVLAGIAGFGDLAGAFGGIAKLLFFGFLAVIVLVLVTARPLVKRKGRRPPQMKPGEDAPTQ